MTYRRILPRILDTLYAYANFSFSQLYIFEIFQSLLSTIFIFLSNIFFVAHINEKIDKILGYLRIIHSKIINYFIEEEYDVSVALLFTRGAFSRDKREYTSKGKHSKL